MIAPRYGTAAGMLVCWCVGYLLSAGELVPLASILGTGAAAYLGAAWATVPLARALDAVPMPDEKWFGKMLLSITTTRAIVSAHTSDLIALRTRVRALERAASDTKN